MWSNIDTQIVVSQLQAVILALQASAPQHMDLSTGAGFAGISGSAGGNSSSTGSGSANGGQSAAAALYLSLLSIRQRLLCVESSAGELSPSFAPWEDLESSVATPALTRSAASFEAAATPSAVPPPHQQQQHRKALEVLCDIVEEPTLGETVTAVSIGALLTIVETPCAFLTTSDVQAAMRAVGQARSEVSDPAQHEVLLLRMAQLLLACVRHPALAGADEEVYVRAICRILAISQQKESSPLLRRTAEDVMKNIVMCVYSRARVTAATPAAAAGSLEPSPEASAVSLGRSPSQHARTRQPSGAATIRFVSSLISREVVALDEKANPVDTYEFENRIRDSHYRAFVVGHGASLQLEGLWLAQYALIALAQRVGAGDMSSAVRAAIQHDLCRALLIAGVSATHVVVLTQILRTTHLAVKVAMQHLAPQLYSFLKVLHLQPLRAIQEEITQLVSGGAPGSPTAGGGGGGSNNVVTLNRLRELSERRDVLTESLAEFCSDKGFAAFCYLHYDLSWSRPAMLPQILHTLLECTVGAVVDSSSVSSSGAGGFHPSSVGSSHVDGQPPQTVSAASSLGSNTLGNSAASSVTSSSIKGDERRAGRGSASGSPSPPPAPGALLPPSAPLLGRLPVLRDAADFSRTRILALHAIHNMIAAIDPASPGAGSAGPAFSAAAAVVCDPNTPLQRAKAHKATLDEFSALFAADPIKKGIPFLLEKSVRCPAGQERQTEEQEHTLLVIAEPAGGREVGERLHRLSIILDKRILGDYIGELGKERARRPENGETCVVDGAVVPAEELWEAERLRADHLHVGTVRFFEQQLIGFMSQFQFRGKPLLTAVREMVYLTCLPGESQKIDRVMEAFALQWYEQNTSAEGPTAVNPFHGTSGAFVLSFAIIMLNTDLHSGKMDKPMTLEGFKSMNRGIDDGNNLPDEYLTSIYEDVKRHEIVMAEMMDRGFANDTTWDLEMNRGDSQVLSVVSGGDGADGTASASFLSAHEAEVRASIFQIVKVPCIEMLAASFDHAARVLRKVATPACSLRQTLNVVRRAHPAVVECHVVSLQGLMRTAHVAARQADTPAVEACVATLLHSLPPIALDGEPAEGVAEFLRNVVAMLSARELFRALPTLMPALGASAAWVGEFLVRCFVCGLFSAPRYSAPADTRNNISGSRTEGRLSSNVQAAAEAASPGPTQPSSSSSPPETVSVAAAPQSHFSVLLEGNPGLVTDASLIKVLHASKKEGGGGWFSSFFGGSEEKISDAQKRQDFDIRWSRLRECIPDICELLRLFSTQMSVETQYRLTLALCVFGELKSQRDAYVMSYRVVLVCGLLSRFRTADQERTAAVVSEVAPFLRECFIFAMTAFADFYEEQQQQQQQQQRQKHQQQHQQQQQQQQQALRAWGNLCQRIVSAMLEAGEMLFPHAPPCLESFYSVILEDAPRHKFWATLVAVPASVVLGRVVRAMSGAETTVCSTSASAANSPHSATRAPAEASASSPFSTPAAATSDPEQLAVVVRLAVALSKESVKSNTKPLVIKELCEMLLLLSRTCDAAALAPHMGAIISTAVALGTSPAPAQDASAASSGEWTPGKAPEIVAACCRLALHHGSLCAATAAAAATAADETPVAWRALWKEGLIALCQLVTLAPTPRSGSEALLNLQRCLLDLEPATISAATRIANLRLAYDEVLFPLIDRVCAPDAQPGRRLSGLAPTAAAGAETVAAVSAEVQCKLILLLPKVLLRYSGCLDAATGGGDVLRELWRRVLGTLYAIYTCYPPPSHQPQGPVSSPTGALVCEAVEETVKNMIFVVSTPSPSEMDALKSSPTFWSSTRQLVAPFEFSPSLLPFIQSQLTQGDGGGAGEGGCDATSAAAGGGGSQWAPASQPSPPSLQTIPVTPTTTSGAYGAEGEDTSSARMYTPVSDRSPPPQQQQPHQQPHQPPSAFAFLHDTTTPTVASDDGFVSPQQQPAPHAQPNFAMYYQPSIHSEDHTELL